MRLVQIVYASSAATPFSKAELLEMLGRTRERNNRRGITGILLYKEGNILQVIEGEERTADQLFKRVSLDPRHKGIMKLMRREIEEREFPNWSMAFRDLGDVTLHQQPGYSDHLNYNLADPALLKNDSKVLHLIASFSRLFR
ncbi:Sensors of blue-light using FAD family [Verrucomicrobiia bacterium DG1235]|nr:Sensors of blue-light using FAD family [Verrucomicrobiae bacterium DG1235]